MRRSEFGGAALEYIIVTVFAAAVSLGALSAIGKVIDQQLERLAEKTNTDIDDNPLFDP